jgi:CRISPR system Cascade subunit CasB
MTEQLDPSPTEKITVASIVGRLAYALESSLSAGDVAELRRLRPKDVGSPAFWKIAALYLEPAGQLPKGGDARDEAERRWAAILQGLAALGPLHRHGIGLGGALAVAGFAELRFVRLLGGRGEGLLDLVRTTAQFLAAKGQSVDWTDAARLVLSGGRSNEETVRRRLARDYYRNLG